MQSIRIDDYCPKKILLRVEFLRDNLSRFEIKKYFSYTLVFVLTLRGHDHPKGHPCLLDFRGGDKSKFHIYNFSISIQDIKI